LRWDKADVIEDLELSLSFFVYEAESEAEGGGE